MRVRINNILLFLAIFFVFGCGLIGGGWGRYTSIEGGFSVLLPAEPKPQKIILDSDFGQTYLYMYMLDNKDGFVYSASYVDYPLGVFQEKSVAQILDDARDGAVRNVRGKLLSESSISIKKHPGREIMVESATGKAIVKAKIFLINHRLYNLNATASKEMSSSNNFRRFLDSFEIREDK